MRHTFGVLGPVLVRLGNGGYARLSGRQRAVLAMLAFHAGAVVPRDRLEAAVWDDPPPSAVANLQTYIAQLRRIPPVAERLLTVGSGYQLRAGADEVDLLAFREHVRRAQDEDDSIARAQWLERAIGLWRGRPAEDAPLAATMTATLNELEEQLAEARHCWAQARLALGLHVEVVTEMRAVVTEHPMRERAWELLIAALSQAGRRAEALAAYRQARAALVAELGIEPGPALRALHSAVLSGDIERPQPRRPICQLPAEIADFVGREDELDRIAALCATGEHAPAVVVLTGPPGVGKSTLAVTAAHRQRDAFPDGQLYLQLGGAIPRDPAALLAELLRALHAPSIPDSAEERATLYRSTVADRSMLIVLDDAADERQVIPLMPGTPRCAVLVTSRGPLPALPGACVVRLAVPSPDEAMALLERIAGRDRVRAEPAAAAEIVSSCGALPLAVRVAGARLATRPAWPLANLADRLTSARTLDELALGSQDVRTHFALSYEALAEDARRAFRMLGLSWLRCTAEWAVAALMDCPDQEAEQALETLTLAGLVATDDSGRYRVHDLLLAYARERAHADDHPARRAEALDRFTRECLRRLRDAAQDHPPAMIPPDSWTPTGPADGGWLHAERETLMTAIAMAEPPVAAGLGHHLAPFLAVSGFADEAVAVLNSLLTRAPGQAQLTGLLLADISLEQRRSAEARRIAQEIIADPGSPHIALYAMNALATCHLIDGDLDPARPLLDRAVAGFEALGDINGLVNALNNAAGVHVAAGEHRQAVATCRRGLAVATTRGLGDYAARLHRILGISLYTMGQVEEAIRHYEDNIAHSRELGWGPGVQITMRRLGEAYAALGRHDEAAAMLEHCRDLFTRTGDTYGQALTAYTLGDLRLAQNRVEEAREHFMRCHRLSGDARLRARALQRAQEGLADR
ncbi:BTAD domain-containing putative transcriptional regulator [Streptosporangium sandarakinum]